MACSLPLVFMAKKDWEKSINQMKITIRAKTGMVSELIWPSNTISTDQIKLILGYEITESQDYIQLIRWFRKHFELRAPVLAETVRHKSVDAADLHGEARESTKTRSADQKQAGSDSRGAQFISTSGDFTDLLRDPAFEKRAEQSAFQQP